MNCMSRVSVLAGASLSLAAFIASPALGIDITFDLLTWGHAQATPELPSAVDVKPSGVLPAAGDWLAFTADDVPFPAGFNPAGAVSHNFADLTGVGGSGFNQTPSLSGSLTMAFASSGADSWNVGVTGLSYTGQATPVMQMNQFLVTPGSPATLVPAYNVDGVGNSGTWSSSSAGDWALSTQIDFYFATNADANPNPADIDVTFNNKTQEGYLIPVDQLTLAGMAAVTMDDPAGFFGGDFEQYLLDEIAPRLPGDATYLLVTQMGKVNPEYAETGLPFNTGSLVGNTTFAYTTQAVPEPMSAALAGAGIAISLVRRQRNRRCNRN